MRAAGLQIDGHADHVAATWFGIAYQSLKFQIGIFSDALVLHADIQAKRARCLSGFGDVEKASLVFVRNELMPLQKRLHELNKWVGAEVIRFDDYVLGVQE